MKEAIQTKDAPAAIGTYSQAVRAGDTVYVSGQIGFDPASWPYWSRPAAQAALQGSVLRDVTSVMDFGIIVGALLAAALAGRFAPTWRIPLRSAAAAVTGGLLLGYGARLAYGCNIGAYFSGIASGSLHR